MENTPSPLYPITPLPHHPFTHHLMPHLIAISGPSGSGKTTWISQFLKAQSTPQFYVCPGLGEISVDLARIGYRFPWVQVIPEAQLKAVLADLPEQATVYFEWGFHLDLGSSFLAGLPCQRIAVLPPDLAQSEWHAWADQVVVGNPVAAPANGHLPEIWCTPLTGQVFDPPSLDALLIELTGGAYGQVQRMKGIFEMPSGQAFYVDFVEVLPGMEYTELNIPPWLGGRPSRFSGIEVVGWGLEQEAIAQTLIDGCLSDAALAQYHQHYQALDPTLDPVEEPLRV
ncbi:MAG: GTP-binding protein [Cyanobacteria bacterium]|nr:GTP-binding protein [Cyanobacteriota bacterium]